MAQTEAYAGGQDRQYETIYVLRPDVDRQKVEELTNRVSDVIAREGGKLTRMESWGRRRLAYPVQKHTRGVYVYLTYVGRGGLVSELERNLRLADAILKYQTVKIADGVRLDTYEVSEEDLKFEHVEPLGEDDVEESKARALGLEEIPRAETRGDGSEGGEDNSGEEQFGDEGDDSSSADTNEEKEK